MHFPNLPRALAAAVLLGSAVPAPASDHADPIVINPMAPARPQEPGITDLHVFPDSEENPQALIVSLCVRRSLQPGNPLNLEPYTYRIFMDLHPKLRFDDPGDLARYGGTVVNPGDISPDVTLTLRLNNDTSVREYKFDGLFATENAVINGPFRPGVINLRTGIFDDPFIFPRFFRTNVTGMVFSIPLRCFPAGQREWLIWATTAKGSRQIDHVGRSQRTQLPRFDALNTVPPKDHVAVINRIHEHPTLMEDILRTFISPIYARRPYDAAPDVMIYSRRAPARFPNGRRLEDDVADLIAQTGDTQLFEVSYTDSAQFPRATTNDKEFRTEFPYLADPWTDEEIAANPVPPSGTPRLTAASKRKLLLIAGGFLALLALTHWLAWRLGRRYARRT